MDLETLKVEHSFRLENGMTICHYGKPGSQPGDHLPDEIFNAYALVPKFNGCYAVKNSTVCFIHNYEVFVTPMAFVAVDILDCEGFHLMEFDFPLAERSDDYPRKGKPTWDRLVIESRDRVCRNFEQACLNYSHRHGVSDLDPGLINSRCFDIRNGFAQRDMHGNMSHVGSVIVYACDPLEVCKYLGTYDVNNGKVTFVHTDGKTYCGRARYIEPALIEAGFEKKNQYVFLSSGQNIVDERLQLEWERKIAE